MSDRWAVHHGDCREVMQAMDAESVDSIVSDPPYGLSFMGKGWDHGVPGVEFWEAALRVAKPGAHLLAFGGTRTFHRLTVAIEDAGWEVRDCLGWLYGSGFPKSHNLHGEWQGWGTALKPAWEPIILARKPLSGTVAANVLEHGTGAINVDGCRVAGVVPKTVHGVSSRQGEVYGKYRDEPQESNPSLLGRWPANLIHDGSDEVVGLFPANAPSGGVTHQPNRSGFSGFRSGRDDGTNIQRAPDSGSAARFFYCAKASKRDRDEGCEGLEERACKNCTTGGNGEGDKRTIGRQSSIEKEPLAKARNHHPTVKPTDLMRYLCRLITPPDGLVFDPFTGSGSTGKAAMLEGLRFVGAELSPEYIEIARARIGHAAGKTRQKELALA